MSASCPNCGTAIEQDFGLVNCTGCGKLVSVDVDGIVQSAEIVHKFEGPPEGLSFQAEPESAPEEFATIRATLEPAPIEGLDVATESTPDQPVSMNDIVVGEAIELGAAADLNMQQYQGEVSQQFQGEAQPDFQSEGQTYASGGEDMIPPAIQLEDFSDAPQEEPPAPAAPVPFNKEISDFANQDVSHPAGALSYEVEITGIDSGAVRTEVLRALVDPRFSWSPTELGSKIKSGRLVLSPLHPAAAVIVVRRLQPLNVRLQWRQTRNG